LPTKHPMSKPRHAANVGLGALILLLAAVPFRSDFGYDLSAYTRFMWPLAPLVVLPVLAIAALTLAGFDDDRRIGPHPYQTVRAVLGLVPFIAVFFSAAAEGTGLGLGPGAFLLFITTAAFAALNAAWPYLPFLTDEGTTSWQPPGQPVGQWASTGPQQTMPQPTPASAGPAASEISYPCWVALAAPVSASDGTDLQPGTWYWATGAEGEATTVVRPDGTSVTASLGGKVAETRAG